MRSSVKIRQLSSTESVGVGRGGGDGEVEGAGCVLGAEDIADWVLEVGVVEDEDEVEENDDED